MLDDAQREVGQIDEDVTFPQLGCQPSDAFHVGTQLFHTLLHGCVKGTERPSPTIPSGCKPYSR
jgi:hypothetical protein